LSKSAKSEVLVTSQRVSKKFCRNLKKSLWYGVKDGVTEIIQGQSSDTLRKDEFWALDDVFFELRRGECLGLLGRNGAGKTTLLKVLSGLIKPDKGTITLKGKVGGLIALGAGFNGILSGRENIRINGAILGYPRSEIEETMQEIIDFAEIEDFIDAPVSTYSSGMNVRLGFAIAAILTKPDILLLDEVLAVGDMGFTMKCLNAVRSLMKNSAVIFVSHNVNMISEFCTQTIELDKGKKVNHSSNVYDGIEHYISKFIDSAENLDSDFLKVSNLKIKDSNNNFYYSDKDLVIIPQYTSAQLFFDVYNSSKSIKKFNFNICINDNPEHHVIAYNTNDIVNLKEGNNSLECNLGKLELNGGKYSFMICISDSDYGNVYVRQDNVHPFIINSDKVRWGSFQRETTINLIN
jgi:lipopolysaccharide transport system ATP-binding protein